MSTDSFEKLGVFYVGKDASASDKSDAYTLYDSSDLTTHATIIGMTGSGKTGLGVGLIEEALIDGIPVIAIDPKGDLGNLKLTFPKLSPADFEPWIDAGVAKNEGLTVKALADKKATLWQKGLENSGQTGRIQKLKNKAYVNLYTPGMVAGQPVSILNSLACPQDELKADPDMYAQRIEVTATSLLTLIGVNADPLVDREHILLSTLLKTAWDKGENIELADLIPLIQNPTVKRVGVLDIEQFYPQKDRFKLAMRINGLLASPSFNSWLSGPALDIDKLMYHEDGTPCASVMQISHLSDEERMFFVTLLLSEILSWMRKQSGTGSLRAIIYIDELFGYMPPNANPPSKKLLLTLLKQARAFGVGLVLSTQNPVDLDYKGLANCGTWFLGRMQTKQDRARVLDGLQNATMDRGELDDCLANLQKRQFLLHNVHENQPVVFNTRWCLSYLAGPISREQAIALCKKQNIALDNPPAKKLKKKTASTPTPVMESGIDVFYANPTTGTDDVIYMPELFFEADVAYISKTHKLDTQITLKKSLSFTQPMDYFNALDTGDTRFVKKPMVGAEFADCPSEASQVKNYKVWQRELIKHIRLEEPMVLLKSSTPKLISEAGESKQAFIARVKLTQREQNDLAIGKLKDRYTSKLNTLENRALRAEQAVEREQAESKSSKLDVAIAVGSTLLGALFGRKALSSRTITSASSTMRRASRAKKQAGDVAQAKERFAQIQQDIVELNEALEKDIAEIEQTSTQTPEIETVNVRAKSADIVIKRFGLLWNGRA